MYFMTNQYTSDIEVCKNKYENEQRKYHSNIEIKNKIWNKTIKIGGTIAVIISTITYIYSPAVFKVPGILMAIVLGMAVPTFGLWRIWDLKCKIKENEEMMKKYQNRIKRLEELEKTKTNQKTINNKPKYSYEYNPNSQLSQSRSQTPRKLYYKRNRHR